VMLGKSKTETEPSLSDPKASQWINPKVASVGRPSAQSRLDGSIRSPTPEISPPPVSLRIDPNQTSGSAQPGSPKMEPLQVGHGWTLHKCRVWSQILGTNWKSEVDLSTTVHNCHPDIQKPKPKLKSGPSHENRVLGLNFSRGYSGQRISGQCGREFRKGRQEMPGRTVWFRVGFLA
jgi:hypothetical protein